MAQIYYLKSLHVESQLILNVECVFLIVINVMIIVEDVILFAAFVPNSNNVTGHACSMPDASMHIIDDNQTS